MFTSISRFNFLYKNMQPYTMSTQSIIDPLQGVWGGVVSVLPEIILAIIIVIIGILIKWVIVQAVRELAQAIKRARYMALLPYVLEVNRPTGAVVAPVVSAPVPVSEALDETAVAV